MYGGVPHRPQVTAVTRGVDILVATPGRLLQHLDERSVVLSGTEILVLDEADQMLDMGFIQTIRKILSKLSAKRQTLFFSATMPTEIAALADRDAARSRARLGDAGRQDRRPRRQQRAFTSSRSASRRCLSSCSPIRRWRARSSSRAPSTAPTRSRATWRRPASTSRRSTATRARAQREAALADFRAGRIRVLVATDIAARGIDIDAVTHVINYDLPNVPESYVHRIGRTARAGAEGIAISFCGGEERGLLRDIERLTRQSIPSTDRCSPGAHAYEQPDRRQASNGNGAGRGHKPPAKHHAAGPRNPRQGERRSGSWSPKRPGRAAAGAR